MITDPIYWSLLVFALAVFWLLPTGWRLGFLGAVSFGYFCYLEWHTTLTLLAFALCFYFFAPMSRENSGARWLLPISLTATLAYLGFFKYLPDLLASFSDEPILSGVIMPLGISYFTFKLIHYGLEVKRGNIADHTLADFLCYIFLMPIYTAGPIERFDHFLREREVQWDKSQVVHGVTRIIHGLIKKLVIGNIFLASLYGDITSGAQLLEHLANVPTWKVWGFCVLSFLYLYMDFSAYSDIAIGTSRLFGLRIMENFNWPILATNIGSYWQRWHMTLAKWCQSYVYLPVIGLTRNAYVASYMSFTVMGLWHSASAGWIGWGLYHATGVSVYGYWLRYRRKRKWRGFDAPGRRWIAHLITMAFVSGGAVFTSLHGVGGPYDIARVFAKLFFLELPELQ